MNTLRPSFVPVVMAFAWLVLASGAHAEMGGGEGRPTPFVGHLELARGECRLAIDIERISFLVTTVANKYHLVRMLVDCQGESALLLSAAEDRLDMIVDDEGTRVAGVLSLRQSDSAVWDAFDSEMRRILAYPPEIRPGSPVYVFAYFPVDGSESLPLGFELEIASLGDTVQLMNVATAARN